MAPPSRGRCWRLGDAKELKSNEKKEEEEEENKERAERKAVIETPREKREAVNQGNWIRVHRRRGAPSLGSLQAVTAPFRPRCRCFNGSPRLLFLPSFSSGSSSYFLSLSLSLSLFLPRRTTVAQVECNYSNSIVQQRHSSGPVIDLVIHRASSFFSPSAIHFHPLLPSLCVSLSLSVSPFSLPCSLPPNLCKQPASPRRTLYTTTALHQINNRHC